MSKAEELAKCLDLYDDDDQTATHAAAHLRALEANRQMLVEAFGKLIAHSSGQLCPHEDTYRGGSIWEICRTCGAKWADDKGGRPEWTEPKQIIDARAALEQAKELT